MAKKKSFYFSKFGDDGAVQLVNAFCHRAHYFADLWVESGVPFDEFSFTQAQVNAYDDLEFCTWLSENSDHEHIWKAGLAIRSIVPKGVTGHEVPVEEPPDEEE